MVFDGGSGVLCYIDRSDKMGGVPEGLGFEPSDERFLKTLLIHPAIHLEAVRLSREVAQWLVICLPGVTRHGARRFITRLSPMPPVSCSPQHLLQSRAQRFDAIRLGHHSSKTILPVIGHDDVVGLATGDDRLHVGIHLQ